MTVTWVLENDVFSEACFTEMVEHLKVLAIPYHIVRVIPFVHEIDGEVPQIEGPVVVYGSIGIQKLAAKHGWTPGVWTAPTELLSRLLLRNYYLNADLASMAISKVQAHIERKNLMDSDIFIKPDADTKEFPGEVMKGCEFTPWYTKMKDSGYLNENNFGVVISSAKTLGCEWRVVVVDGEISGYSLYRQWQRVMPERHILPEVQQLVLDAHERFAPAPVYVMDVCQLGDEFKIIEYNTFNSAGLYACDVGKIIDDINALVERTYTTPTEETIG